MAKRRRGGDEPPARLFVPPRYRAAWLLSQSTAYGWHAFTFVADEPIPLLRCVGCHGIIAAYELDEGYWMPLLGRWCPGILRALPPGESAPQPLTLF